MSRRFEKGDDSLETHVDVADGQSSFVPDGEDVPGRVGDVQILEGSTHGDGD